ncbi:cation:proton antiporter [Microbacterium sp. GXF7504]
MSFVADFLLIPLLAVLAPVLTRSVGRWLPIPVVVFELVLGIVAGPAVLGWAQPSGFASTLADVGLAMLFFVAGSEIEFRALSGRTGKRAILGWFLSLLLGLAAGFVIAPGEPAVFIGIALCSTALGTLLPILRDADELRTPFGRTIAATGAVGEFGPLVAISVFLGGRDPGVATVVLAVFLVLTAAAVWYALRGTHGRLHRVITATLHTSGQFAIRVLLLILVALVALSVALELDMLLGAFAAGVIWQLLMRNAREEDREQVESKIEAVAFGFLVPVFFVYTGVTFDLQALLDEPALLLLVPVGALLLLVVRGLPSMLAAPQGSSLRDRSAVALMGATALPIIVAVTAIGVDAEILPAGPAAALVAAGMLSVLLFPLIAMALRRERIDLRTVAAEERL